MNPWVELGKAAIPNNGGELIFSQRGEEFSIRLSGVRGELMNSRVHGSEESLAELGCAHITNKVGSHVLVGGLGMGFTMSAALRSVSATAKVTVAELIPEVVEWNKGILGDCANRPLDDVRSCVHIGDVAGLFAKGKPEYDAILLDVDNGPEGLTQTDNHWLYSEKGIHAIARTLKPEGMLAIWSAGSDPLFVIRLKKAKFNVTVRTVRARPGKGGHHIIFLAKKRFSS